MSVASLYRVLALVFTTSACNFAVESTGTMDASSLDDANTSDILIQSTWELDAISGRPVPASLEQWQDFIAAKGLSIAPPDGLWLCQEIDGDITDAIGSVPLHSFGTVNYRVQVPGWERTAVATAEGSLAGLYNTTAPSLPNVSSDSIVLLALVALPTSPPAAPRSLLFAGVGSAPPYARVDVDVAKHLVLHIDTTTATGTTVIDTKPFALMLKLDQTHNEQLIAREAETISIPYTQLGNGRGIFVGGASHPAPEARLLYLAAWYGTAAEFSREAKSSLLQALAW